MKFELVEGGFSARMAGAGAGSRSEAEPGAVEMAVPHAPAMQDSEVATRRGMREEQLAAAQQLGGRLRDELREVLGRIPEGKAGASALSRALRIDRATCQRVVFAARLDDVGVQTLVRLPGVEGLRLFLRAARARVKESEFLRGAEAAVDRFEALLGELGVSQRGLRALLECESESEVPVHPPADDRASREALFRAGTDMVGRWSRSSLHVSIIRTVPGSPLQTEWARVRGLYGHQWRDMAVPLELGGTATLRSAAEGPSMRGLEAPSSVGSGGVMLEEFCSKPLAPIVSKAGGKRVVQIIDTGALEGHGPADIVTATRVAKPDPHPGTLSPPVGEVWALQNFPTRRLVFDTYLHRDLARRCFPSVEAHLWMPDVATRHDAARWSTRLAGGPGMTQMKPGSTDPTPRYTELMGHVMSELAWSADEFVGFRCEIEYPVWRAGYVMLFDFASML